MQSEWLLSYCLYTVFFQESTLENSVLVPTEKQLFSSVLRNVHRIKSAFEQVTHCTLF